MIVVFINLFVTVIKGERERHRYREIEGDREALQRRHRMVHSAQDGTAKEARRVA